MVCRCWWKLEWGIQKDWWHIVSLMHIWCVVDLAFQFSWVGGWLCHMLSPSLWRERKISGCVGNAVGECVLGCAGLLDTLCVKTVTCSQFVVVSLYSLMYDDAYYFGCCFFKADVPMIVRVLLISFSLVDRVELGNMPWGEVYIWFCPVFSDECREELNIFWLGGFFTI